MINESILDRVKEDLLGLDIFGMDFMNTFYKHSDKLLGPVSILLHGTSVRDIVVSDKVCNKDAECDTHSAKLNLKDVSVKEIFYTVQHLRGKDVPPHILDALKLGLQLYVQTGDWGNVSKLVDVCKKLRLDTTVPEYKEGWKFSEVKYKEVK